jgi:hypothetical protein
VKLSFFGDSYDIVKQSLLRWLAGAGRWSVHPMFTEPVSDADAEAFARLLGAPLISSDVLSRRASRDSYFASAVGCTDHLFLDPDTGLRLRVTNAAKAPSYLFFEELVQITQARPKALTLVFDQCLARGREREQLEAKLAACRSRGLHGLAYVSHACFILVGKDSDLSAAADEMLRRESRLPAYRLLRA